MKRKGVSHSPGLFCVLAQCVGSLLWFICCQCGSFAAGSLNCRCSLASAPPERKLLEKGSFLVFSAAGVTQVANYFVHGHFCCCDMLIWCYCVRCKVEVPAVFRMKGSFIKWLRGRINVWAGTREGHTETAMTLYSTFSSVTVNTTSYTLKTTSSNNKNTNSTGKSLETASSCWCDVKLSEQCWALLCPSHW